MKDLFPEVHETLAGINKRVNYIYRVLCRLNKPDLSILDVGCGSGQFLSLPLAQRGFHILGIDIDEESIARARELAREKNLSNARFEVAYPSDIQERFDVVIMSEVIEHVHDSQALLQSIYNVLRPGGYLIITMPNGFGPSEIDRWLWKRNFLFVPALHRRLAATIAGVKEARGIARPLDTCNENSPHVKWFSWGKIRSVLSENGFRIRAYRPRTFVNAGYLGVVLQTLGLLHLDVQPVYRLNGTIADRLPPQLNSGWMFVCQKWGSTQESVPEASSLAAR